MKAVMILMISGLGLLTLGLLVFLYWVTKKWITPRVIKWIATKKSLPLFPNGLAMLPKENRHYFFGKNNAFDHFFTYTPGAGYLYQFFPNKTNWPHPSTKYFLIENVGTKGSVDAVAKKLKENYGEYSIDLTFTEKRVLEKFQGNPTIQGMTLWQQLCWNWNIYWYATISGQETLLYNKITFADVSGDGKTINWRHNEQSAVLFSSFYEYGVESDETEDINNIRLQIIFSISGKCINPDVSGIKNENPLKRAYSMLQSCAGQIAKMSSFHLLHESAAEFIDGLPDDYREKAKNNVQQIRDIFQKEIIAMLSKHENFIGFEWGPDSVNILQVRVHEEDKKILQTIIDSLAVQFENKIALDKAINANKIKEANAETEKNVAIITSKQLLTVRKNTAKADAAALEIEVAAARDAMTLLEGSEAALGIFKEMQAAIMSDGDPNAVLLAHALKGVGGINLNSLNLGEIFTKILKPSETT